MEQERFMVIDNQKGVVIPLQSERMVSIDRVKSLETEDGRNNRLEDKVNKIHVLIKALVKQSIQDTIREYNLQLTKELKEYEQKELKRWEKLEEADSKRWDRLEQSSQEYLELLGKKEREYWEKIRSEEEKHWKQMEDHFKTLDKNIRQKQDEGKRKKHSVF